MTRLKALGTVATLLLVFAASSIVRADRRERTLVVTMTNDPVTNQIKVYDADTRVLTASGAPITIGVADANGVAILSAKTDRD